MTYQLRNIGVTISLANGSFSSDKTQNTLYLDNCRCLATSSATGGVSGFTLEMSLYGLSMEQMGIIAGTGFRFFQPKGNMVKVEANGVVFFEGMIVWSRPDYNQAPDIPLNISAIASPNTINEVITDTHIQGDISLKALLATVGAKVGLTAIQCSVDMTLTNITLKGSAAQQLNWLRGALSRQQVYIDTDFNSISAYQGNTTTDSDPIILSADTGMIGYPTPNEIGLSCGMIYSPAVKMNKKIRLTTAVPNLSGDWIVTYGTGHSISSWVENGPWFTNLMLFKGVTN